MVRALRRRLIPVSLLVTVLAVACSPSGQEAPLVTPASAQRAQAQARAQAETLATSRRTAIVDAATRVAPSVVSINVVSRRRMPSRDPFDFFSFFVPRSTEQVVQGYGTGFVVRRDGVILTNQHVVDNAETITVSLPDGTDLPARLLGEDPTTDIAVLKVEQELPPVAVGRSRDLLIGEWVVALGNPYTYLLGNTEPSVTAGVVSALGRNVLPNREQPGLYLDMIQTDAAINPGNSGGPLTNASGEVVGVNSFIFSSSGGSVGLGFAIPIERALRVADEIVRAGAVRRAWTGLQVAGAAAMRDWKSQGGLAVTAVDPGGPAARAGIRSGMILEEANGRRLRNYLDWEAVKLDLHVGDTVRIRIKREGGSDLRRIVTGDLPTVTATRVSVIRGLEVITVTGGIQAERGLRTDRGALIYRITPEVSQATGLQEGDVILYINRTAVTSAAQVASLLETMRSQEVFRITFERQGVTLSTTLSFR
jgi:serine protease Do